MAEYDFILEIRVPLASSLDEELDGLLYLLDCEGSISHDEADGRVVRAFFRDAETRRAAYDRLLDLDELALDCHDVERRDWLESYQQSLRLIEVGSKFVVAPIGELIPAGTSAHVIVIPQERAFGTGSHETTWLCLDQMDRRRIEGKLCADIGTGSGILAIGMARLGARKVVAFDNDLETFGIVTENLARNSVAPGSIVEFYGSAESLRAESLDYAVMNIIPEVIIPLLPRVSAALRPMAHLLLSGILNVRRDDVVAAARDSALALLGEASRGEWWCGEFVKMS